MKGMLEFHRHQQFNLTLRADKELDLVLAEMSARLPALSQFSADPVTDVRRRGTVAAVASTFATFPSSTRCNGDKTRGMAYQWAGA